MKYCNKKCLPQCSDIFYTINPENIKMQDVGYDSDLMWVYIIVFNEKNVSFFFEICNYSYYFDKFLIIVAFYWGVKRLYSYIFFLYLLFILFIFLGTTSIKIKCLSYTYFSAMPRTLSIARKVSSAGIHSSVG